MARFHDNSSDLSLDSAGKRLNKYKCHFTIRFTQEWSKDDFDCPRQVNWEVYLNINRDDNPVSYGNQIFERKTLLSAIEAAENWLSDKFK